MGQCTDILDLVYLRFAENIQRVHIFTELTAASWILEPFGDVGGDVIRIRFLKVTW